MEGIPDRGCRSPVTGIADKAVLAALGDFRRREAASKRRSIGGESREATGMPEARSCESSRGRERPERRREKKTQGPPKRIIGVVKRRILRTALGRESQ